MRIRTAITGLTLGSALLCAGIAAPAAQASPVAETRASTTQASIPSTDGQGSPVGVLGWVHVAYFDWPWTCEAAATGLRQRGIEPMCRMVGAFTWELLRRT